MPDEAQLNPQPTEAQEQVELSMGRKAHEYMYQALKLLDAMEPTTANLTSKTELITAMMWNNRDRTQRGEMEAYETHATS